MLVRQISVFMENSAGQLFKITDILAKNGIDMRAMNIADTADFGILRLIVNDPDKAEAVLRKNNMTVSVADVIAVSIDDKTGAFNDLIAILKNEGISIDYSYSFMGKEANKASVVIKTSDLKNTIEILNNNGACVIPANEVYDI